MWKFGCCSLQSSSQVRASTLARSHYWVASPERPASTQLAKPLASTSLGPPSSVSWDLCRAFWRGTWTNMPSIRTENPVCLCLSPLDNLILFNHSHESVNEIHTCLAFSQDAMKEAAAQGDEEEVKENEDEDTHEGGMQEKKPKVVRKRDARHKLNPHLVCIKWFLSSHRADSCVHSMPDCLFLRRRSKRSSKSRRKSLVKPAQAQRHLQRPLQTRWLRTTFENAFCFSCCSFYCKMKSKRGAQLHLFTILY